MSVSRLQPSRTGFQAFFPLPAGAYPNGQWQRLRRSAAAPFAPLIGGYRPAKPSAPATLSVAGRLSASQARQVRLSDVQARRPLPRFEVFMTTVTLDTLDLVALLCFRMCHDVISPVGAIVNGLEVLEDETEPAMRDFALDHIRKSARQASARLQFARLAFGAAGSAGASIDLGEAEQVARGMFQDDKVTLTWSAPRALLPKNKVRLLLNLLVTAMNAIPRGGAIEVVVTGVAGMSDAPTVTFTLRAKGLNARIPPHAEALFAGAPEGGTVDAHGVQTYYAGLVARAAGMRVSLSIDRNEVTIWATSDANQGHYVSAPAAPVSFGSMPHL